LAIFSQEKKSWHWCFFLAKIHQFLPQIWLLFKEFYFRNVNLTIFGEKQGENGWYDSN
jgi:hypothetical protein